MPEEAELHPIRRGCRGNRRLLPERLVSYKGTGAACFSHGGTAPAVARRGAAAFGASLGEPADPLAPCPAARLARRRFQGMPTTKACHDVGMLQQDLLDLGATLTPPILIISFSRPRSHLPPPASQRNSIIVSSRQGRARRGSRAKKDCAISARVVPLIVLSRRWGTRY